MLARDFRHAFRSFAKRPAFTAIAIFTLALGIGANTAIFSVVYGVVFRSLPYEDSERLVVLALTNPERGWERVPASHPDFLEWREETDLFDQVAAHRDISLDLTGAGEPERVSALEVSEGHFQALRSRPVVGRTFTPDDFEPGSENVVILSKGLWQRRFGAAPDVVGSTIRLSDRPFLVAGVVDEESVWPRWPELWTPLSLGTPLPAWAMRWDNMFLRVVARLQPDVSIEQAHAQLTVLAEGVADDPSAKRGGYGVHVYPLDEWIVRPQARLALLVLLGAVGFVLLIACVNVANLLLARAVEREREVAIRLALGAGRRQLFRQWLTESMLLALFGGVIGILLAGWSINILRTLGPENIPRLDLIRLEPTVLLFALGLSTMTAVAFSVIPFLHAMKPRLSESLKESGQRSAVGSAAGRIRTPLVVSEIALSLVLLIGAGLLLRSFGQILQNDPGLRVDRLLALRVRLPDARYPEKNLADTFFRDLIERVETIPGVQSASATSFLPLGGNGIQVWRAHLEEGKPEPPTGKEYGAPWSLVTPGYFKTMGIPLLQGRDFTPRDDSGAVPVTIINEHMARLMFPNGQAVGKRIRSWRDENRLREIIGVVGNVRFFGIGDEIDPGVYIPYEQGDWTMTGLVVRASADPMSLAGTIRAEIWNADPDLPVTHIETMDDRLAASVAGERFNMLLLGLFAVVALVLAAVGIYGMISYSVSQRTHEIGLRMALGARRSDVLRAVIGQGLVLTSMGLVIGLALAFAMSRVLSSLLYEVSATDAFTYVGVSVLLVAVTVAASFVPAFRATLIDPVTALRDE